MNLEIKRVVTWYSYRTASVSDLVTLDYARGDDVDLMRTALAKMAGKTVDNHTAMVVETTSGQQLWIRFSDWRCGIGLTGKVGNW